MTSHNGLTNRRWNLAFCGALAVLFLSLGIPLPAAETNTNRVLHEFTALAHHFTKVAPQGGMGPDAFSAIRFRVTLFLRV